MNKLYKKSHARYVEYLNSETSLTFAEYFGIDVPVAEYIEKYGKTFVRFKNEKVAGEFCKTKKEAKASYKEALKRYRENFKLTRY
jgi:hypothetical protein